MSRIIEYAGRHYVAIDALTAAAQTPHVLGNALLFLKIGADAGHTVAEVFARMLAGYVLDVAGVAPGVRFTEEQRERLAAQINQPMAQFAGLRVEIVPAAAPVNPSDPARN